MNSFLGGTYKSYHADDGKRILAGKKIMTDLRKMILSERKKILTKSKSIEDVNNKIILLKNSFQEMHNSLIDEHNKRSKIFLPKSILTDKQIQRLENVLNEERTKQDAYDETGLIYPTWRKSGFTVETIKKKVPMKDSKGKIFKDSITGKPYMEEIKVEQRRRDKDNKIIYRQPNYTKDEINERNNKFIRTIAAQMIKNRETRQNKRFFKKPVTYNEIEDFIYKINYKK